MIDKNLFDSGVHGLIDLLLSDKWPQAVSPFLICDDTDKDKSERAESIFEFIDCPAECSFLDFGCGEGHLAKHAQSQGRKSLGFDIICADPPSWDQEGSILTSSWDKVIDRQPFDFVCLYDVLDHSENPTELLCKVRSVCHKRSKVFVRCHPWMSRHGGHHYRKINKAWVHLVFTEDELLKMGAESIFVHKYYFPLNDQKKWFIESGFSILHEDRLISQVENIFQSEMFRERLPLSKYKKFPVWQMSQTFNDYVLQPC